MKRPRKEDFSDFLAFDDESESEENETPTQRSSPRLRNQPRRNNGGIIEFLRSSNERLLEEIRNSSSSTEDFNLRFACIERLVIMHHEILMELQQRSDPSEIKRRDLDQHCIVVWRRDPEPSSNDLYSIIRILEGLYPNLERRIILSTIRRWFRKKREEVSQRIYSKCTAEFENLVINDLEAVIRDVLRNRTLLNTIADSSNTEIQVQTKRLEFTAKKIESFIRRAYERRDRNNN